MQQQEQSFDLSDMLKKSSKIKKSKSSNKLSLFWNNTSMARTLDIFLENRDTWINIGDFITIGGLSRKSIRVNTDILLEHGVIEKEIVKYYTFFRWRGEKSSLAKHLEKLHSML